tara:strand:+ start:97 stop:285 length:189 start_codon:yes stop_codon:yes gene_type:complete
MGILLKFPTKETLKDLQDELVMCDEALLMIMEQMQELNNDLQEVLKRYEIIKEKIECKQRIN